MTSKALKGLTLLQIALKGSDWLQMVPHCTKWLQVGPICSKWLKMAQNVSLYPAKANEPKSKQGLSITICLVSPLVNLKGPFDNTLFTLYPT